MTNIAVIGFSGRFPQANSVDEFWENLCLGKESITFLTEEQLLRQGVALNLIHNPDYVRASPLLKDIGLFDAEFFGFSPKEASALDPQQRLLLECAWETLELAGYAKNYQPQNIGTFIGSGGVVTSYLLESLLVNPDLRGLTGCFEHLANDKDFIPTRLSYKLNLTGPSLAVQTACSTSLLTVHMACQSILNNECTMALAGGVNVRIPHVNGYLRQKGDIYSADGHIRTFDADASGILFGSGAGLVLLKRLDDALRDGDTIHAVIKGSAVTNDGAEKLSYTASSFTGQVSCIQKAFATAQIDPASLSYVEAHGTGTVMGDPIEVSALNHVFRQYTTNKNSCALGSVKANVGHLDTAAGIVSLIKTIMMLKEKKIPPQINLQKINPKIHLEEGPFYVTTELKTFPQSANPLRAGVNSLGIGGTNVFLIVEEAPQQAEVVQSSKWPLLLNVSAKNQCSLETLISSYQSYINTHEENHIPSLCYTTNVGRGQFPYRISVLAQSCEELKDGLAAAQIIHTKEKRIAFYLNTLSRESLSKIQTLFSLAGKSPFDSITEYLAEWMSFGVKPRVVCTSLEFLAPVAYLLGYISREQGNMLMENIHDMDDADLIAQLNAMCQLGHYATEIILLPTYCNLLDFMRNEHQKTELVAVCDVIIALSEGHQFDLPVISVIPGHEQERSWFVGHTLHQLYLHGVSIDWQAWYQECHFSRIPLPTYPFKKRDYWISRRKLLHPQQSVSAWDTQKIHLPQLSQEIYQLNLSRNEYPVLRDHDFFNKPMLAASVLISWLIEIAEKEYHVKAITIQEFQFTQALFLNDSQPQLVQCVIELVDKVYSFKIRSYHPEGLIADEQWVEHAQGSFVATKKERNELTVAMPDKLPLQFDAPTFYEKLEQRGLVLSSAYRCLQSVQKSETHACGQLNLLRLHLDVYPQSYHPALFDALFQVVQALVPESYPKDQIFLLTRWGSLHVFQSCQLPRLIQAQLKHIDEHQLTADVFLLNDKQEILCAVEDVVIHSASRAILHTQNKSHYQKWEYVFEWNELTAPWPARPPFTGRLFMLGGHSSLAEQMLLGLAGTGITPVMLEHEKCTDLMPQDGDILFYALGLDEQMHLDTNRLQAELTQTCQPLLQVINAFADKEFTLVILTQGAVSVGERESHLNPLQMCLWGMGRTIAAEWVRSTCHLVDLDPDESVMSQIPLLTQALQQFPDEGELALRKNHWYTARLVHYSSFNEKKSLREQDLNQYLKNDDADKICASDEVAVAIDATGLSYRDALQIGGLLHDNHPHVGDDFVGTITRVGNKVSHLKPGDKVIGLHQGTLGSSLIVPSYCVASINTAMPAAEIAAWPLAYLTASYCWLQAPLKEGQWVFIMSAGSGVGYIAAQRAKLQGAHVIATVNGIEKEYLLKNMGVDAVINMQHSTWSEQLHTTLQNKKLSAVFSSTHPEMTEKLIAHLLPAGKILDLTGGRYAYSAAIKEHKGFIPIRMYEVIEQDAKWVQNTLVACATYLQSKQYAPIPVHSYSVTEIEKAVNQLKNPNHFEKVILVNEERGEKLFQPQATYIIVGGLGALGEHLIPWMLQEGAQTLCVIDRAAPNDKRLVALQRKGIGQQTVRYFQCDITQLDAVKTVFATIKASLPPIKGIFNIATLLADAPIGKQTWDNFQSVVSVKAQGSLNLHWCSLSLDCDYFVMFSSLASLMGSQNQLNYSAANAFQDSLACHRAQIGLPALAINWSPWQVGIGAYMGESAAQVWKTWGSHQLNPTHDLESLRYLLTQGRPQIALLAIDWQKFIGQLVRVPPYLRQLASELSGDAQTPVAADNEFLTRLAAAENKTLFVTDFVREEVAACLRLMKEELESDQSFASLGVDSLLAISLRDHIQKKIGHPLPAVVIFTYPTIGSLAEYILSQIAPAPVVAANAPSSPDSEIVPEQVTAEDLENLLSSLNKDDQDD